MISQYALSLVTIRSFPSNFKYWSIVSTLDFLSLHILWNLKSDSTNWHLWKIFSSTTWNYNDRSRIFCGNETFFLFVSLHLSNLKRVEYKFLSTTLQNVVKYVLGSQGHRSLTWKGKCESLRNKNKSNRKNYSKKINISKLSAVDQWFPSHYQHLRLPMLLLQQCHAYCPPSTYTTKSHRKCEWSTANARFFISVPEPLPPKKKGNVGRKSIILSSLAEDTIRYVFHQMLSEKIYPTISTLLARLQKEHPDFPIRTESTLLKTMKRLGFKYRATSKLTTALE